MPSVKEVYHKIEDVRIEADTINLNVDGVEALLSTAQADLALIKTDVDDIRADMADGVSVSGTVTANGGDFASASPNVVPASAIQLGFQNFGGDFVSVNEDGVSFPVKIFTNDGVIGTGINSLPISGTVTADSNRGNVTEASIKTITTGGTHQQVFASNANRKFLLVQNVSDTDMNLGIGYNPTASTGIFLAKSGGGFVFESSFIPTQEIRILCATTGKAFVALEG